MGQPSYPASNAVIYVTYGVFLVSGLYIAYLFRHQSKREFLSSNGTQKAWPLALNFIASAMGSGILFTYPQIAVIAGIHGLLVYALASALPLLLFGYLGPKIRKACPEGFVLTEWVRQRYGIIGGLFLSFLTLVTMFLYMIAELSALGQIISTLTGLNDLPVIIVECVVTTIYTSLGGFRISFITDNIQGFMVLCLVILGTITVGAKTHIDRSSIDSSGLLKANLLGWQLLYILPIAIITNDFFLASFWMRAFASRSDRDLRLGTGIATIAVLIILVVVGVTGLLAVWAGVVTDPDTQSADAFFLLLAELPGWVIGIILVLVVALSTAAFDSLQSAMVSTASNDLFRNKLGIWWIRGAIVLIIFPVVVIALKAPNILQIYLISDLISSAIIPVLFIGLWPRFYYWSAWEVIIGGLGGLLSVFIYGAIYYKDALKGAQLMLLESGLYEGDWGAFGAFVAAPVGGFLFALATLAIRSAILFLLAKKRGEEFTLFKRKSEMPRSDADMVSSEDGANIDHQHGVEESTEPHTILANDKKTA